MMTSKCHHAIVCSCEKVHSHLFVRVGNNDKAECPHCQNAALLEALKRIHINSNTITQSGNAAKIKGALIAINRTTTKAIRNA